MAFRRTVTIHAWTICLAGILFTGWGPGLLPLYGFNATAEFFPSAGVARVLVESHLEAITVVTAQPIGIWVTPLGWVTVAVFLLITLAYVALLYMPRWRIRVPQ